MGRNESDCGSRKWRKGGDLIEKGEIFLSKDRGLQNNDEGWNQPKNVIVMVPI